MFQWFKNIVKFIKKYNYRAEPFSISLVGGIVLFANSVDSLSLAINMKSLSPVLLRDLGFLVAGAYF